MSCQLFQIRIFDERLEIWSPGLLPKELNIKSLLAENRSIPRFPEDWRVSRELMIEAVIINWSKGGIQPW